MAGGDLLFIVAFIILPTVVLVSCIWSLVLIKKGVLLPERQVPVAPAGEVTTDEDDAVEAVTAEDFVVAEGTVADEDDLAAINETSELVVVGEELEDVLPVAEQADMLLDISEQTDQPEMMAPNDLEESRATTDRLPEDASEPVSEPVAVELTDATNEAVPAEPAISPGTTPLIVPLEDEQSVLEPPRIQRPRKPARRLGQARAADEPPARARPRVGQRRAGARVSAGPTGEPSVGEGEGLVEGRDGPADLVRRDDE